MLLETLALLLVAGYLLYYWASYNKNYFKDRGIPYDEPFPLFGSMLPMLLRKKAMFDIVVDLYNQHDGKIYGIFDQRQPVLLIRDPEIIKQIAIKEFDHFINHRPMFLASQNDDNGTGLFANSLFSMRDGNWKDMRSTLSPAFTGSKMRQMFQLMNDIAAETVKHMKRETGNQQSLEVDFKDYCTRFANDVIASTAFGLQVNSFDKKNNEFYLMGKKMTNFTAWMNIKFFLYFTLKPIFRLAKVDVFDTKSVEYFRRLVLDAMKYRKEHNISRPDMINMLMEARGDIKSENQKAMNREWSDVHIVAQCFLFFFAGFETAAVLMSLVAHELMENSDVQDRLVEEIDEVSQALDGKALTYEAIMGMKYLDQVISETLRKWPGAIAIDRECNKDFVYEADDGERIEVKKGDLVWFAVAGIHRDPKYFEEPNRFDPERFSEVNKDQIMPGTYLPFGIGPRNCIGSRFALLEAKSIIFYLLREFRIEPAKNSTVPLVLAANGFQISPKTGFWLKFTKRN